MISAPLLLHCLNHYRNFWRAHLADCNFFRGRLGFNVATAQSQCRLNQTFTFKMPNIMNRKSTWQLHLLPLFFSPFTSSTPWGAREKEKIEETNRQANFATFVRSDKQKDGGNARNVCSPHLGVSFDDPPNVFCWVRSCQTAWFQIFQWLQRFSFGKVYRILREIRVVDRIVVKERWLQSPCVPRHFN